MNDIQTNITFTPFNKFIEVNKKPLRIFSVYSHLNWEDYNLKPALEKFGEVIRLDWEHIFQRDYNWIHKNKPIFNKVFLNSIKKYHKEKPLDIIFCYLSGKLLYPEVLYEIKKLKVPIVNMSLDDADEFIGPIVYSGFSGVAEISSLFDLCWTSSKEATSKYKFIGANPIYLPPAANPDFYVKKPVFKDINVSFIGRNFGNRNFIITQLKNKGINVQTFGKYWENGEISNDEMVDIINRSKINLGFSGAASTSEKFSLKARDFEIPMAGGLYITQYHYELEYFYQIEKEIICYPANNIDLLAKKIIFFLNNPHIAEKVRVEGHNRCINEHTWENRFKTIFKYFNLI